MMETTRLSPPQLVQHKDYRVFLKDFYLYKKAENKKFSFRRFAQLAGIKSSNYLMLVMQSKRGLSEDMAARVAKAMKLSVNEREYFVALVKMAEGSSAQLIALEKERRIALKKMISKQIPKDKVEFFKHWHHAVIREFVFLKDFKPSGEWISKKMRRLISAEEASESLQLLLRLGLIKETRGKWVATDVYVDSGPEEHSFEEVSITNLHKQFFAAWSKVIGDLDKKDRELGAIHIPIRKEKIPELKKRIQDFQDEIIGWLQDEKDADLIVQLGTYLVPITTEDDH